MKRGGNAQDDTLSETLPLSGPSGASEQPAGTGGALGRIPDYVSGRLVRATREEVEAVQVYAKRLVEDYGYPKDRLQTRPQFRVRGRPSDETGSYPVDIAVFRSATHDEGDLYIIVECKEPEKTKGIKQLKSYLSLSEATLGVWFNGSEHHYLRKHITGGGIEWEELPNIPRFGQRVEDVGRFLRRDLKKPSDLKAVFRDLRNHLAGNVTGVTRDEVFAQEIINILFCKIYDEVNTDTDKEVRFRCGFGESSAEVNDRIQHLFREVQSAYADVFDIKDAVTLSPESLVYVVGELQNYAVTEADRDAIADAFEVFIGPALRGQEGQFFTPRNVVKMMIEMVDPSPSDMILDPACGSGGFLIAALEHVWSRIDSEAKPKSWSESQREKRRIEVASLRFRGIDKDSFLSKVTKAYMAIVGDGRGGVFCLNSLEDPAKWKERSGEAIKLGMFDVILTNPPFGKKIRIKGESLLAQFSLGHKWRRDKATGLLYQTSTTLEHQVPQVLFLERCLQFLKPGGRLAIVLPEAIVGMPTYEYVVTFLRSKARVLAVVSMPEALFKTSGKGGTHAKTCVLVVRKEEVPEGVDHPIFLAEAKWCGHDSRGNPTVRPDPDGKPMLLDDVPLIAARYKELVGKVG